MVPAFTSIRHDRESVTETALRLLDEVGLADLSMRRLAAELGVQPSALYWHFENKQQLLAAVADRILSRVCATTHPVGDGEGDPVLAAARRIRDALFAYRDGAEVVMSSYALGLGADGAQALLAEAFRLHSPDSAEAPAAEDAAVLLQFVLGHALLVQQRLHAESHGAASAAPGLDPSAHLEASFDRGVRTFLAGIRLAQDPSAV